MQFRKKDLLGIKQLEPEEINLILETAETFKEISTRPIKKVPTLRGRTVVHLFYISACFITHLSSCSIIISAHGF